MSHPQSKEDVENPLLLCPDIPATLDTLSPVLTKDVPLNPNHNTLIRLFLPHKALQTSPNKLPLIVYFHGGGFLYLKASTSMNHDFCFNLAKDLSAVVASVDYRLAPADRLPAAYDDGVEALRWLSTTDEKWVREHADVSKSYIMGTSSGANLAYHVGLRVAALAVDEFGDLKIGGLILHHPFFGGTQRTESELRLGNDEEVVRRGHISLDLCDMMWQLALPEGADRDHKYSNPTVVDEEYEKGFDGIKRLGLKILVTGCYEDLLISRQMGLVEMLKSRGVDVEDYFGEGYHGLELLEPSKVEPLFVRVKNLIYK